MTYFTIGGGPVSADPLLKQLGLPAASDIASKADLLGVAQDTLTALIASLPTTLPSQPGVLWNNGGVVQIS